MKRLGVRGNRQSSGEISHATVLSLKREKKNEKVSLLGRETRISLDSTWGYMGGLMKMVGCNSLLHMKIICMVIAQVYP